jgi:cob(I)alamin adenosyltransferase
MKIYTKTGDQGDTALFGGKRLTKAALRIESYGNVDELNAHIGMLRDLSDTDERKGLLVEVQNCLFIMGSMLAAEPGNDKIEIPTLRSDDVDRLEKAIDSLDASLPPMRNFVLPGGHTHVSHCHIARTVCRRAERSVVALFNTEPGDALVLMYLNRLSDFLFVLSRKMAQELHAEEIPWISRDK